jgi:hypothetical protein
LGIIEYDRHPYTGRFLDVYDLVHDNPRLFNQIIEAALEPHYAYYSDYEKRIRRRAELATIAKIQNELFDSSDAQPKATTFEREMARIKKELFWAGIQPADTVISVFWQEMFDPLVSIARRKGRMNVVDILSTTSEELREAGIISPDLINRITTTLKEWLERVMNPDTAVTYEVKVAVDKDSADDINDDVLSFFFGGEDEEIENEESDNEESGDNEEK